MSSVTDFIYFLVHTHPYFFLQLSTEALSSWDWLLPCKSFDSWSSSCLFSKPGIWKSQAITTSLLVIKSGCCTTVALFSMRVILPVAKHSVFLPWTLTYLPHSVLPPPITQPESSLGSPSRAMSSGVLPEKHTVAHSKLSGTSVSNDRIKRQSRDRCVLTHDDISYHTLVLLRSEEACWLPSPPSSEGVVPGGCFSMLLLIPFFTRIGF